jgi:hypothetical protein
MGHDGNHEIGKWGVILPRLFAGWWQGLIDGWQASFRTCCEGLVVVHTA